MSKNITPSELAVIVNGLLNTPNRLGELDSEEKHHAFMAAIAGVVCDHCGGELIQSPVKVDGEPTFVSIAGNDSLPEDGGVWRFFDPENSLFDETLCSAAPYAETLIN